MKSSVRVVCRGCLASVDLVPDGQGRWPTLCPSCGRTIDSQFSDVSTPETRIESPPPKSGAPEGGGTDWTQVWQTGSLGTFSRFQIREELGTGGFGRVYKAYDPRLDRDVALKVLKGPDPGERVRQRFFREARAAARLKHPNIAAVHESGVEEGRCWVAFEYVDGRPLSGLAEQRGRPDVAGAVRIVRALADALDHAHRHGVYHRDLKPSNVILDVQGSPHLIDFGLSRLDDVESDLTRDGAVVGTPRYMSPEQVNGDSNRADGRSDLYSLGVIFYELMTGHRPFDAPSVASPWEGVGRTSAAELKPLTPPRTHNPEIPAELERVCLKTLATDPTQRYQSAQGLLRDLDHWLQIHDGNTGLSFTVSTAVLGIAGALLLIVTISAFVGLFSGTPEGIAGPPAESRLAPPAPTQAALGPVAGKARVPDVPAAAAPAGVHGPTVYVTKNHAATNRTGGSYHLFPDCDHVRNNIPVTIPLAEATQRSMKLCSDCELDLKKATASHPTP